MNLLAQTTLLVTSPTKAIVEFPEQLSAALIPTVVCVGIDDAQVTVTGAGQLMVGATLSNTVIDCAQVAVFEQASLAMNVRTTVNLLEQITLVV